MTAGCEVELHRRTSEWEKKKISFGSKHFLRVPSKLLALTEHGFYEVNHLLWLKLVFYFCSLLEDVFSPRGLKKNKNKKTATKRCVAVENGSVQFFVFCFFKIHQT